MKALKTILVATLLVGSLAACDTMNSFHEATQVTDTTKDTKFEGRDGKAQSFCSPAKRNNATCY